MQLLLFSALLVILLRITSHVTAKCGNLPILINAFQPSSVDEWVMQDLLVRSILHANGGWRCFNVVITPVLAARMMHGLGSAIVILVNALLTSALASDWTED